MVMKFIWPLDNHSVSRDFYYKSSLYINGQHTAVDIPAPTGTPIKAVAMGLIVKVGYSDINGNYVEMTHDGGWKTIYRHLVEKAEVSEGSAVMQGQAIGKVGSTGWSTGPHLHFDLWNRDKQSPDAVFKLGWWAHDPEIYLGQGKPDPEVYRQEEDDMKLLFYRFEKTIYAISPDAKARRITLAEWEAHKSAGATFIQVDKNPAKIVKG